MLLSTKKRRKIRRNWTRSISWWSTMTLIWWNYFQIRSIWSTKCKLKHSYTIFCLQLSTYTRLELCIEISNHQIFLLQRSVQLKFATLDLQETSKVRNSKRLSWDHCHQYVSRDGIDLQKFALKNKIMTKNVTCGLLDVLHQKSFNRAMKLQSNKIVKYCLEAPPAIQYLLARMETRKMLITSAKMTKFSK